MYQEFCHGYRGILILEQSVGGICDVGLVFRKKVSSADDQVIKGAHGEGVNLVRHFMTNYDQNGESG